MTTQIRFAAPRRALLGKVVLAAALIAAPAAFGQSKEAASDKDTGGKEYTVVMMAMDFGAIPTTAKVGDTIVWVNHDTVIHSVTARDNSFDLRINPGQSKKLTLMKAGKFAIHCLFHPAMHGSLTVADK